LTQQHLDAQAALWSLRAARAALDVHVYAAHRERGMALVEAADGIGSQTFGTRRSLGGRPGDPTGNAAVFGSSAERASGVLTRRAEALAASTTATLLWLARELRLAGDADPLDRPQAAPAAVPPRHAARLTLWAAEADQRIRVYLGLPSDERLQAEQLAVRLTTAARPITADRIRDWARRSRRPGDPLYRLLPAIQTPSPRTGNAWYRVADGLCVHELTRRVTKAVDAEAA
jgi:hypothetical protein